jgi:hypothetical protein
MVQDISTEVAKKFGKTPQMQRTVHLLGDLGILCNLGVVANPEENSPHSPSKIKAALSTLTTLERKSPLSLAMKYGELAKHFVSQAQRVVAANSNDAFGQQLVQKAVRDLKLVSEKSEGFEDCEAHLYDLHSAVEKMTMVSLEQNLDSIVEVFELAKGVEETWEDWVFEVIDEDAFDSASKRLKELGKETGESTRGSDSVPKPSESSAQEEGDNKEPRLESPCLAMLLWSCVFCMVNLSVVFT